MRHVRVELAPAYDVVIGDGALSELASQPGRIAVFVDENVERLHADRLRNALHPHRPLFCTVPSGEHAKSFRQAEALFDFLAAHRFERSERVVAVGGGVTGDLAGFVAATWRRGVPFVQVPTTLLAMVDASVGGKVAIDHPAGKNLIGAFHQPRQVLADTSFLATLPERESWCGLAEVVKTALLAGGPLFELVARRLESLVSASPDRDEAIALSVAYKAEIVRRDPDERGERAILNLGHTIGHALENAAGYGVLLHGEAVAYGLRAALELSGHGDDSPLLALVRRLRVPPLPALRIDDVLDAMAHDKKVVGGVPAFVLLDAPGRARFGCHVDPVRVREAVGRLLAAR